MGTAFFAMLGWCGTLFPGWWKYWKVPPHPDPEPWWVFVITGLGIAAGAIGGHVFGNAILDNRFFEGQNAIASGLAAFASSGIVTSLATLARK